VRTAFLGETQRGRNCQRRLHRLAIRQTSLTMAAT
jgi:hypothetical protein